MHETENTREYARTPLWGVSQPEHSELPKSELDIEIECPRCNEIMELHSKFDVLVYFCDGCSFLLKCA